MGELLNMAAEAVTEPGLGVAGVVDLAIKVLMALGALGGATAFFMVKAQKKKLVAESGKTDAEAESTLADAQAKRTQERISWIDPYERALARQQQEIDEAWSQVDWLKAVVEGLTAAMHAAGIEVPDEPPRPRRSPSSIPLITPKPVS